MIVLVFSIIHFLQACCRGVALVGRCGLGRQKPGRFVAERAVVDYTRN